MSISKTFGAKSKGIDSILSAELVVTADGVTVQSTSELALYNVPTITWGEMVRVQGCDAEEDDQDSIHMLQTIVAKLGQGDTKVSFTQESLICQLYLQIVDGEDP